MSLRAAGPEDAAVIAAMEQAAFADPWTPESVRGALLAPEYRIYVAETAPACGSLYCGMTCGQAPAAVGYLIGRIAAGEAELMRVACDQSCRRQGIGGALLDLFVKEAAEAGAQEMFLEVRAGNVPAQQLYRKKGFVQAGIRKNYYRHPQEDALVLQRHLGGADEAEDPFAPVRIS